MKVAINFTGGRELERALRGLGNEVSGRLGLNATRAGARVIANRAKDNAPVGETGDLKESYRIFDDVRGNRAGGRERTVFAGSRLFYSYWVEFGTAHSAAKAPLRRARDTAADEAVDRLAQNLGNGIEREAARHRGR